MKKKSVYDNFKLRLGRQSPNTRDYLDVRVYANNYLGFSIVFFGFGIRMSIRIRESRV